MSGPSLRELSDRLEAARESGDHRSQAQVHTKMGKHFLSRNQYQEAARHYQKAVEIFEPFAMINHLARALTHLGVCQLMLNDPEGAIARLQSALDLIGEDQGSLQAAILGNLGLAYTRLNDYAKARCHHEKVLALGETLGDGRLQVQARTNLAEAALASGHTDQAFTTALQALERARQLDLSPSLIAINDLLGMISSRRDDLPSALDYHRRAAEIAEGEGDLHRQAIALANQALIWERLTELEKALQTMQRAQAIFRALHSDYQKKTRNDLQRIKNALETD